MMETENISKTRRKKLYTKNMIIELVDRFVRQTFGEAKTSKKVTS